MSCLKEGLEYYLDSYSDPDFVEDESLYDSLPLGEVRGLHWCSEVLRDANMLREKDESLYELTAAGGGEEGLRSSVGGARFCEKLVAV